MKKLLILVITFLSIGLTFVHAQQAVPLPPLPNVTLTMPPNPLGSYKVDVTSAQLRQLFENRDKRKYTEYLFNSGYITETEFNSRTESLDQGYYEILDPISETDITAAMFADGTVKEEIANYWSQWQPGWIPADIMRESFGFIITQPPETRTTVDIERNFLQNGGLIRIRITPATEQNFSLLKQQLELLLKKELILDPDYESDPINWNEYKQILYSKESTGGKPYLFTLQLKNNYLRIEIAQLNSDPSSVW